MIGYQVLRNGSSVLRPCCAMSVRPRYRIGPAQARSYQRRAVAADAGVAVGREHSDDGAAESGVSPRRGPALWFFSRLPSDPRLNGSFIRMNGFNVTFKRS